MAQDGQRRLSVRDESCGFDSAAAPPVGHLGSPGMGTNVEVLWVNTHGTPTRV